MTPRAMALGLLLGAGLAAHASAQSDDSRFREVSPGGVDLSPLMADNEFRPVDLRVPMGFERLYEIVDSGGLFARRNGAVTAVFDRSIYGWNSMPLVPPGTVYYVGSLPVDLARPGVFASALPFADQTPAPSMHRVPSELAVRPVRSRAEDLSAGGRVDLRVGREAAPKNPPPREPATSMWTDEDHRRRRVGELIRGAAWRWRAREAAAGD
ncbi:MAG: hypothetical protein ACF8LK_03960 [Phycisphaerales bacterium JB041]